METRAHHVLIGFFTLAVAASILLFSLWLVKSGSQQDSRLYDIAFREAVSGLNVGSAVEYSGIRVGEVERLWLDADDPRQVWARVRIERRTPIKTDTKARLALANITGASNIQLSEGSPGSPPLSSDEDEIPVIVAEPSPFAQLRLNSEELVAGFKTLIENANALFSEENNQHFSQVLLNLEASTGVIAEQKTDLAQGIQDLAAASQQMKVTMERAASLLGQLEGQFNAKGERLFRNADTGMAALSRSSQQLESLLKDNQPALASGLHSLGELEPTLLELRATLQSLGVVSRKLEQDPSDFLLGGERIKEFKP
ncbi:MlaD family protein [Oceanisphaera sp. IT1-181]|uniref:MlaD family protein n=1 Tax=Oceanisphaera sp. IT1-181 TaxID=3081199 RepID=UPI0029CA5FE6|nr:MlaD family protein [Oceanisphaera sp. IT1-181]